MAYPDTTLASDTLDPEYGGRPAPEFGGPAWRWINAVVRTIASMALAYLRVPYTTIVVLSQSAAQPGDVLVMGTNAAMANVAYAVRKADGALPVVVLGVCLEGVAALTKARAITAGIVPAIVSGFASRNAPALVGLAPNGRMRVAQVGDPVIGSVDLQGNVVFTGYGMLLT